MSSANVDQKVMDRFTDMLVRLVDTRDELRDDLEPSVHTDGTDALSHILRDLLVSTVRKPQSQQPKRILQRASRRQRDGFEESPNSWHDVVADDKGRHVRRLAILARCKRSDDLEVRQSPGMPCLVPVLIVLCCLIIRCQHVLHMI